MGALLSLSHVSLIREGKVILKDISWTVQEGEQWAILGRNGAGKSMLLSILSTYTFPSRGEVYIVGKKLGEIDVWTLRRILGIVSDTLDSEYPRHVTVRQVVYSGFFSSIGVYEPVTSAMRAKTTTLLRFLGIHRLADRPLATLSHGERRKALLARTLVHDPRVLILDEPCTGLDVASRESFLKSVDTLARKGKTIVFVTHHIEEIMPFVTHVALMDKGKFVIQGRKEAVMTEKNLSRVLGFRVHLKKVRGRFYPLIHHA